jgi:hypothetical protein
LCPSFFKVSPAFGEALPISQTNTIDFSEVIISLDLLDNSLKGIFFDAVMCPALKESESLRSIIIASSELDNLINVCGEIFLPPLFALEIKKRITAIISGSDR